MQYSDQYLQGTNPSVSIKAIDSSYVLLTQFKVKDIDVLLKTFLVR